MDIYGPLRAALFIYECFRFILMIGVFAVLGPGQGMTGIGPWGEIRFPYVMYMVPHALFPLMTCFLWVRFSVYKPYIPLYIAGKTIMVASIMGWGVFSLQSLRDAQGMDWTSVVAGLTLLSALTDVCSILGGVALQTKLHRLETQVPKGEV